MYFGQAFCQSSEKSNKYTRGESSLPKGAMGVPQHWVLLGDQISLKQDFTQGGTNSKGV